MYHFFLTYIMYHFFLTYIVYHFFLAYSVSFFFLCIVYQLIWRRRFQTDGGSRGAKHFGDDIGEEEQNTDLLFVLVKDEDSQDRRGEHAGSSFRFINPGSSDNGCFFLHLGYWWIQKLT